MPETPQFPMTNLNVTKDGLVISNVLAPGMAFSQLINEETMNQVVTEWLKTRKQVKNDLEIIRHVRESKIN